MTTPASVIEKLRAALGLVENLKTENDSYKDSLEKMKLNYDSLIDKNKQISQEYEVICKEKELLEEEHAQLLDRKRSFLDAKDREIEKITKERPSEKEIELLKLEIRDEAERQAQSKVEFLDKECQKFRSLYYKIRREWESLQNETEIKRLCKVLWVVNADEEETSEVERLRATQREKIELELKVKALLGELDLIRAEKEDLRVLFEKEDRIHKRQMADQVAAAKEYHSQKDSLQSRLSILEEEARVLNRRKDDIVEENNRLKGELDRTVNQMEDNAHQFSVALNNAKLELMKEKDAQNHTIEELKSKIVSLKKDLRSQAEMVADLKARLAQAEREYLDKLRLSKEGDWAKISSIESEKVSLEKQVAALRSKITELENSKDALFKDYANEADRLKKELQAGRILIERLETDVRTLQTDKEQQQIALEQARIRGDEAINSLADSNSKLDQRNHQMQSLNEKLSSLESHKNALEQQVEQMNERLGREMEAYEHTIERQQLKFAQEKQAFTAQIEQLTRERLQYLEKIDTTEEVLEKQQKLFESKIQILKEKIKIYRDEMVQTKKNIEAEQLRNLERQQEVKLIDSA